MKNDPKTAVFDSDAAAELRALRVARDHNAADIEKWKRTAWALMDEVKLLRNFIRVHEGYVARNCNTELADSDRRCPRLQVEDPRT